MGKFPWRWTGLGTGAMPVLDRCWESGAYPRAGAQNRVTRRGALVILATNGTFYSNPARRGDFGTRFSRKSAKSVQSGRRAIPMLTTGNVPGDPPRAMAGGQERARGAASPGERNSGKRGVEPERVGLADAHAPDGHE